MAQPSLLKMNRQRELGGLKVEVAESLPRNFSLLTDASSFGSTSDLSSNGGDTSPHQIVQMHPSSTSASLTTTGSSPSVTSDEDNDLEKSGTKRFLLEQKIKTAEGGMFSASTKGYVAFNESQSRYVQNLRRALMAMDDHVPLFMDERMEEAANVKINLAVDSIVELADSIKELSHAQIISRLERRPQSITGSLGEAQEAIEHYLGYIKNLKAGESEKTAIKFCSAKKCESRFKQIETREKGDQKASDFHEVSRALERAGDEFSQAAKELENNRPNVAELYEKSGACFERKSACYKAEKSMEGMTFAGVLYLDKAGTSFSSAAKEPHRQEI